MSCRCNTERHDPDCHIDHTLSALEADIAFPQRGQESNPNPMHSRCGLEDCDCEYTIGRLLGVLDHINTYATRQSNESVEEAVLWAQCASFARVIVVELKGDR